MLGGVAAGSGMEIFFVFLFFCFLFFLFFLFYYFGFIFVCVVDGQRVKEALHSAGMGAREEERR